MRAVKQGRRLLAVGTRTPVLQRVVPLLQRAEIVVEDLGDALQALARIAAHPFDLVIAQPPLVGAALARLVRAWRIPMNAIRVASVVLAALAAVAPARADLERELENRWRGAWVLTRVETGSDCTSVYTDTDVRGELATAGGRFRFAAGELARVDKVGVKVDRVDLFLAVAEPVLEARVDGPFTLYDERRCRVQLKVAVPKKTVRAADADAVGELLGRAVEAFAREDAARGAPAWNGRLRDPLPEDYAETLERYHAWKLAQETARLTAIQEDALDELEHLERAIDDDPVYLAGLAAGLGATRNWRPGACSGLTSTLPSDSPPPPPAAQERDRDLWRRGWEDGRDLAAALAVVSATRDCLAALPAP